MSARMERGHGAAIMPMIQKAVNESNFSLSDFTGIAVTIGPGSFTGLRIAMAAAKGLAISRDIPLTGISCFEAVAQRINQADRALPYDLLLIALNSKREDLYLECRDALNKKVIPGGAINSDLFFVKLKKLIGRDTNIRVVGDGSEQLLERAPADIYDNFLTVNEKDKEPLNVCDVARCAFNETSSSIENIRKNIPRLTIDYLRSPDFTLSKN
jgi:tRNA threonylcarbamoyl adenosine modification protein YeaZ